MIERSLLAEAKVFPSGAKVTQRTSPRCPVSCWTSRPSETSHSLIVMSTPTEANVRSSGEKVTDHTASVWPRNVVRCRICSSDPGWTLITGCFRRVATNAHTLPRTSSPTATADTMVFSRRLRRCGACCAWRRSLARSAAVRWRSVTGFCRHFKQIRSRSGGISEVSWRGGLGSRCWISSNNSWCISPRNGRRWGSIWYSITPSAHRSARPSSRWASPWTCSGAM